MRVEKLIRQDEAIPLLIKLVQTHRKIRELGSTNISTYLEYQTMRLRNVMTMYTANLSQIKQAHQMLDRELDLLFNEHQQLWYQIHCLYADLPTDAYNEQMKFVKLSEQYYAKSTDRYNKFIENYGGN